MDEFEKTYNEILNEMDMENYVPSWETIPIKPPRKRININFTMPEDKVLFELVRDYKNKLASKQRGYSHFYKIPGLTSNTIDYKPKSGMNQYILLKKAIRNLFTDEYEIAQEIENLNDFIRFNKNIYATKLARREKQKHRIAQGYDPNSGISYNQWKKLKHKRKKHKK